jgi:NAD(P)H-flavin reductase
MIPHLYRVADRRREGPDVVSLAIEPTTAAGEAVLGIRPGQFNMLYAFGHGEVPISVSRLPGEAASAAPLVHTVRAVGSVSKALTDLEKGATVGVRGPFGRPWPLDRAAGKDVVIVTGGIGLAPLRPLVEELLKAPAAHGSISVLLGARSPGQHLFPKDVRHWMAPKSPLFVELTVDHVGDETWTHHVGVVTTLLAHARFRPKETVAYLCGPEVMMRFGAAELLRLGVAADDVYVSLERNMKCAVGHCGHCQLGPHFICKDGPVFSLTEVDWLWRVPQL